MDRKKLVKRKKKASKPRHANYFEELSRPITYILDDVKETVIMNYGSFARSDTKLVSGPVSNVGVNL